MNQYNYLLSPTKILNDVYVGFYGFLNTLTIKDPSIFCFEEGLSKEISNNYTYNENEPESFLVLHSLLNINIAICEKTLKQ